MTNAKGDIIYKCPFTMRIYRAIRSKSDKSRAGQSIKDYYKYASDVLTAYQKYVIDLAKISQNKNLILTSDKLVSKINGISEDISIYSNSVIER